MNYKIRINRLLSGIAIFSVILSSCTKPEQTQPAPSGNYTNGVWIINEGNYLQGNASIDFYHKDKDTIESNVFENVNKHPLGDVLQSITHVNGQYFMVLNSSHNIVVTDDKSMKLTSVIDNLGLPRYLLPVNNQKAYLTNETSDKISILDLGKRTVTGHIDYNPGPDSLRGWTEQMAYYNNNLYITAIKTGKLLVVNTATDKITDTISLSVGAKDIVIDKENKIWILCDGTLAPILIPSKLYRLDPSSKQIISQFDFPDINSGAGNLNINRTGDMLFFVSGSIYKMGIHDQGFPAKSFINGSGHLFYGLGIDPDNNTLYAGDQNNFTQPGVVLQYSPSGKLLKTHKAGVGPNGFLFVK